MHILPLSLLAFALAAGSGTHKTPQAASAPVAPLAQTAPTAQIAPVAPIAPMSPETPFAFAIAPTAPLYLDEVEPFSLAMTAPLALDIPFEFESAAPFEVFAAPQPDKPTGSDPVYDAGLKAMDEGRWADAVKEFDKVAATHPDRKEAALYWKAYSLEKLGRTDEARASCDSLAQDRPASRWNRDCMLLRLQNGKMLVKMDKLSAEQQKLLSQTDEMARNTAFKVIGPDGAFIGPRGDWFIYNDGKGEPHDPNDDLKLIALNSLMQQEPGKAVPILRTFILSNKPLDLRRHALFILSRSKAPEAQSLLVEIANNSSDPSLQRVAVQTLATGRGKQASPELLRIYRGSQDKSVKRAAVSGLFSAQDAQDLVDLARSEKDIDMKREIVTQLALMHDAAATAYMEELLK